MLTIPTSFPTALWRRNLAGVAAAALLAGALACGGCSSSDSGGGTTAPDTTPPSVVTVTPVDQAQGVPVTAEIQVQFSEAINPDTATPTTISVLGVSGSVSASGATAVFTPNSPLDANADFSVQVTQGVRDLAGNALDAPWSGSFRTADRPAADAGADQVASRGGQVTLDASGSAGVAGGTLTYAWTQLAGPDVGMLSGMRPTFTAPDSVVTLVFSLEVQEDGTPSADDLVSVIVSESAASAFFVASTGNDADTGRIGHPLASLQAAIDAAWAAGGGVVHLAAGTYAGPVVLADGVSLYGGYDATTWQRDALVNRSIIGGSAMPMRGAGVANLVLDGIEVLADDAMAADGSSVGITLVAATNVIIRDSRIEAGRGANGANGDNGSTGSPGANGGGGENHGACIPARQGGGGGNGGTSRAGGTGGNGGFYGGSDGGGGNGPSGGGGGGGSTYDPNGNPRSAGDGGDAGYAVRILSGTLTWLGGNDTTHVKGEAQ